MGSVLGNTERDVKVSDELTLSFETSGNYNFSNWTVFVNDKTDDNEEYVKIFEPENKTTKIKFLKNSDNIIIRPVCYEFLNVKNVTPDWGYVSSRDSTIEVNFNANVDIMSFRFSQEDLEQLRLIKDGVLESYVEVYKDGDGLIYAYKTYDDEESLTYKNIEITCDNENILKHYGIPRVQNNVLTIPVDYANLIHVSASEQKNISVFINKNIKTDAGITMLSDASWKYKIGNETDIEKDNKPPVVEYFIASKNSESLTETDGFTEKSFSDFLHSEEPGESDYLRNCITGSFVFNFTAADQQTGIKKFCLTEKLLKNRSGEDKSASSIEYTTEYSSDKITTGADGISAAIEAEYSIKTMEDGAIQIKLWTVDNNNNPSEEKVFTVITDRKAYLDTCRLYNEQRYTRNFTLEIGEEEIYNGITSALSFDIYCGEDPREITTSLNSCLTKTNDTTYTFEYNDSIYPSAFTKHTYIKVIARDKSGNENSFIQIVPKDVEVVYKDSFWKSSQIMGSGSNKYDEWTYYICMDSTYGITWTTSETKKDACHTKTIKYDANYTGQIQYEDFTCNPYCYYDSSYGTIYSSPLNRRVTIARESKEEPFDLTDENGMPVTFEVTKEGQDSGFYIYKVTTSGRVLSKDNLKEYAGFMLKVKEQYCVYFEGTEEVFLIPASDNIQPKDFSLVAIDSSHISGSSESEVTQETGISSLYWDLERAGTEGVIRNVDYNLWCGSAHTRYKNEDYTGDYIKIISPNQPKEPSVSLVPEATVYYKKIGQDILEFQEDKKVYSGSSSFNCSVLNPNALIDYEMLTYEQIEQFDSMTVYEQGTTKEDKGFFIPIFNLQDGDYIFFVKIKDSAGDINYGSFHYKKSRSDYKIENIKITSNSISVEVSPDNSIPRLYRRIRMDYIKSGKWNKACEAEIYYDRNDRSINSAAFTESSSWMKIYFHESDYQDVNYYFGENTNYGGSDYYANTNNYFYYPPIYVYPNGSVKPSFTSTNVGIKNIFEGKALSILCSQPALAQTFQSPVNYGENAEDWEYYTRNDWCLNPVQIPAGGGNYEIPVDEIKSGHYYCMIVQFSDGSTMMSSVQKKQ